MPVSTRQRLIDLLAMGRVANLPTVWSNVILGFLLAWSILHPSRIIGTWPDDTEVNIFTSLSSLILLLLATTCAYLFGTFLNDWKDADFDREHRPERAIPSARWSRGTIGAIAALLALIAGGCFLYLGTSRVFIPLFGLGLLASIVVYTVCHKKSPLAIVPMGLCRSLLYVLGFSLVFIPGDTPSAAMLSGAPGSPLDGLKNNPFLIVLLASVGILAYVAGLTLAARYESRPETMRVPRTFLWLLIFLPFLTHSWWWIWERPPFLQGWHLAIPVLCALLPFLAWTLRALVVLKTSIPDFVSRALAGLCLVDLLAYAGIAATIHSGWAPLDASPLLLALVPLSLFIFALLLQRLAPAT